MTLKLIKSETFKAQDHLARLNSRQLELWNKIYPDPSKVAPIDRNDIEPEQLVTFLSNLWMADIVYKPDGTVTSLTIRLIGTGLVPHYGEVTGQALIKDFDFTEYQKSNPVFYERLKQVTTDMIRAGAPLFARSVYHGEDQLQIDGTGLVFPMCRDSEDVNMVFGFTQLETSRHSIMTA